MGRKDCIRLGHSGEIGLRERRFVVFVREVVINFYTEYPIAGIASEAVMYNVPFFAPNTVF